MATKNKTAKITDQQQVEEKLKKINANIVEITKLVQQASSLQTKSAKTANDRIETLMTSINDEFQEVKKQAEQSLSPNSEIMKKAKAASSVPGISSVIGSMDVLPIPTKLTYLSRFIDFWDKSVREITKKIFRGKGKFNIVEDNFEEGNKGYALKSGKGYIEKDTMNEFMGGLLAQVSAGVSPNASIDAVLSGNPLLREEMGSVITVLKSALGAVERDQALYSIEKGDMSFETLTQNVAFKESVDKITSSLNSLSASKPPDKKKAEQLMRAIDRSIERLAKLAEKTKSTIDISYSDASGNQQVASFDAKQREQLKTFFEQNNKSIFDVSYTDTVSGVVTDVSDIDQAAVERAKLIAKERKIASSKRQVENFLKSITITAAPKRKTKGMENPTRLFKDEEIAGLSGLFFAAYVNLPKFEQEKFKELGLDSSVIGSQSLSVARMNLARIVEKVIATKVLNATAAGGQISTGEAVYKRDRQKNMQFNNDPSSIINKILFSISPTEFPIDWTIAFASEQQLRMRVGDKDYRVKSDSFFLDPNLNMNDRRVAQGDHIIAYNQGGSTIPRNLLALSSSLNQSKQDAETGLDQILFTVYTQNRLFGENSELDWIKQYEKSEEIIGVNQVAKKVSQSEIDLRRKKLKYPSEEIAMFNADKKKLATMNDSANALLRLFNQAYDSYVSAYQEIQKEYNSLNSNINSSKREVRDILRIGLEGKSLQKDSEFKRLVEESKKEIEALKKLLPVGNVDRKVALDIAAKYNGIVKTINNRTKDAQDNADEYRERLLEARRITDEFFEEMEKTVLQMREAQLSALNALFTQFGGSLGLLTSDLKKGEQAFRGSRTAGTLKKTDFPTPVKIEDTIIYKNKEAYQELVDVDWKKAEREYQLFTATAGKKGPETAALANSLKGIEDALRAVMAANEFVLFSEFFE